MNLEPHEQVLISGGRRELLEFGSCKHCVVVDWRDDVETILADVKRMLPEENFSYRRVNDGTWELHCRGDLRILVASNDDHTEVTLRSINCALMPEYEMRIFTPTIGDGYSLLLRPTKWWNEFSEAYGARARKLFVTTDKRVELTRTDPSAQSQPKNWLSRLFGT